MKATIELPDLPDGWEVVGHVVPKEGDMYLNDVKIAEWIVCDHSEFDRAFYITARRKQTLADWANEQPDLQVLARLLKYEFEAKHKDQKWDAWVGFCEAWPKPPCDGHIETKDGKWVDA